MTIVYSIDTGKYDPISYGSDYLYNQFDRIQSFLLKQNSQLYRNVLAKPVLLNGQVQWYANFDKKFSRITDLSEDKQNEIKARYWEVKQQIDAQIQQLSMSKDGEKQNWANLLKEVFNDDDNLILTDGMDWCLLWGWKFRNKRENYLSPEFMPKSPVAPDDVTNLTATQVATGTAVMGKIPISDPERIPITPAQNAIRRTRPSLWVRIKRFLRTMVYRLWGLMLLIMLILFLSCLFKACYNKKMKESCMELDKINQKLIEVDKKVQDRCIETKK